MAARAIANGRLPPLHATRGTRAHIVESLAPCVLRAREGEGAEGDALVSARLLTLLVENHGEALFSIPEPLARLARGESSAERTPPRMQELLEDHAPSPIRLRSHAPSPVRPNTGSSEHPRRSVSDGSVSPRDRRKRSQEYPASPPRLQQLDAQRPRDAAKGPARTRPSIKPPLLLLAMTKPFKRKSSLRC
ncbi:DEP domain-containing protein 1B-like [Lethenteron reissneri]|uniref:DEP domain-containing protein 1B-like n=1 Tax=Lethenteron reissneri TaxID=7753 RepID=UPI002AB64541|nr:DEP domain-containing protein 1B-like [Lethenteron reissneri]